MKYKLLLATILLAASTAVAAKQVFLYPTGKVVIAEGNPKICFVNEQESISKCWTMMPYTVKKFENRVELGSFVEETDIKAMPPAFIKCPKPNPKVPKF